MNLLPNFRGKHDIPAILTSVMWCLSVPELLSPAKDGEKKNIPIEATPGDLPRGNPVVFLERPGFCEVFLPLERF